MKHIPARINHFCAPFFLALLLLQTVSSAEIETDEVVNFDRSDSGNLKLVEGDACNIGKEQSPIDIKKESLQRNCAELDSLEIVFRRNVAVLQKTGHDITVAWYDNGGNLKLNGTYYYLNQLHFHHPSEHTIDGVRYPLEKHLVHLSLDGGIAVVSVLYDYGEEDEFLAQFTSKLHWMAENGLTELEVGIVEVDHNNFGEDYYRYKGSLTTPPCTEGVIWTIMKRKWTVTGEQVQALMEAAEGDNARDLQELNGRKICYYCDEKIRMVEQV